MNAPLLANTTAITINEKFTESVNLRLNKSIVAFYCSLYKYPNLDSQNAGKSRQFSDSTGICGGALITHSIHEFCTNKRMGTRAFEYS